MKCCLYFEKVFLFSQCHASKFLFSQFFCFLLCVFPSLQFEKLKLCLILSLLDWSHA